MPSPFVLSSEISLSHLVEEMARSIKGHEFSSHW